ncbi:hypothetical protein D3C72_1892950 [compost metagenome]
MMVVAPAVAREAREVTVESGAVPQIKAAAVAAELVVARVLMAQVVVQVAVPEDKVLSVQAVVLQVT